MSSASFITEPRVGHPGDIRIDEAVVRATLDQIEEHGFDEITFAAIAQRAGTTSPAIYRRWSSKSNPVLHAVFRTEGPDVVAVMGDLEQELRTMVRWTIEKCGRPVGRAALAELLSELFDERAELLPQVGIVWRGIGERLARAVESGELRNDVDTNALISVTAGAGMLATLLRGESAVDEAHSLTPWWPSLWTVFGRANAARVSQRTPAHDEGRPYRRLAEALLDVELAHTPMGRLGTAQEIAGAVQFLASSAAIYITGHVSLSMGATCCHESPTAVALLPRRYRRPGCHHRTCGAERSARRHLGAYPPPRRGRLS